MKFKNIYSFEVISKIEEGKKVFILDRLDKDIFCANDLRVRELVDITSDKIGIERNRYDFWIEEEAAEETKE